MMVRALTNPSRPVTSAQLAEWATPEMAIGRPEIRSARVITSDKAVQCVGAQGAEFVIDNWSGSQSGG
jgi:hypothetical protein